MTLSVKNSSNFEFVLLFHHLHFKGKSAANSKLELFLTEWSRSYIFFALRPPFQCGSVTEILVKNSDLHGPPSGDSFG